MSETPEALAKEATDLIKSLKSGGWTKDKHKKGLSCIKELQKTRDRLGLSNDLALAIMGAKLKHDHGITSLEGVTTDGKMLEDLSED